MLPYADNPQYHLWCLVILGGVTPLHRQGVQGHSRQGRGCRHYLQQVLETATFADQEGFGGEGSTVSSRSNFNERDMVGCMVVGSALSVGLGWWVVQGDGVEGRGQGDMLNDEVCKLGLPVALANGGPGSKICLSNLLKGGLEVARRAGVGGGV